MSPDKDNTNITQSSGFVKIPVIKCHERQDMHGALEFFCPYCKVVHHHGIGNGHRTAHCFRNDDLLDADSPYLKTGYNILLEYPYTKTKETIYSYHPRVDIKTRRSYSFVRLDLGEVAELTQAGKSAIDYLFSNTFFSKHRRIWSYTTIFDSGADIKIKKELRFHIAQSLLDIATDPVYILKK